MYQITKTIDQITGRNVARISRDGQIVAEAIECGTDGVMFAVRMSTGQWTRNEYEMASLDQWCARFETVLA
jgi:hypothetical protein